MMNTEEQILAAARKVFINKGFDGARMQEIADEAGINKALLHYYFRTKEKLFERIFSESFQLIKPVFNLALGPEPDLHQFIRQFVNAYHALLKQMPFLPQFVLQELNRNPGRMIGLIGKQQIPMNDIKRVIDTEVKKGNISAVSPENLIVNLISLIIFPFVARPVLQEVVFGGDDAAFDNFLNGRSESIIQFFLLALSPEKS